MTPPVVATPASRANGSIPAPVRIPLPARAATAATDVATAANDAAAPETAGARSILDTFRDPLWMLAIAMGVFFAVVFVLIAVG